MRSRCLQLARSPLGISPALADPLSYLPQMDSGEVCEVLEGAESLGSISSRTASVSPMVGLSGEQGGVSTGTEHLFSLSTKADTSGEEGTEGVKSLHAAGYSSPLEGTLFWEGNFLIFTLSLEP